MLRIRSGTEKVHYTQMVRLVVTFNLLVLPPLFAASYSLVSPCRFVQYTLIFTTKWPDDTFLSSSLGS